MAEILNPISNPILEGSAIEDKTGEQFFASLIPSLITLGLVVGSIVFLFMLIIGAIQWITSGGDKTALEAARGRILNAIIGIILLFSVFVILRLISNFFGLTLLELDFGPLKIGSE